MSGPTMSMIDSSNAGIGNYKGVMLCNRPFGGSGQAKPEAKPDTRSFHAGKVPSAIGSTVPITTLDKHTKRPKKESALTKHRKWLSDLQKTKDELESKYINELTKKETEKGKFQEREAKQRKEAMAMLHKENEGADAANAPAEPKTIKSVSMSADEKKSPEKKKTKSSKPAWALTETAAEEVSEDKDFEDAEGLLDFAAGLNFEKYIDDLEVQTMMEKVKQRIMNLEREVQQDEKRMKEAEERAANRPHIEGHFEEDEDEEVDPEDAEQEAAMNAARALLANTESMKAVHSTKSVAVMVKHAKDKDAKGEPVILNQPKIVTHDESAGIREKKDDVSNLPYIHRNPAV